MKAEAHDLAKFSRFPKGIVKAELFVVYFRPFWGTFHSLTCT